MLSRYRLSLPSDGSGPASFEDLRGPHLMWLLCKQVPIFIMIHLYHPSLLPNLQLASDPSMSRGVGGRSTNLIWEKKADTSKDLQDLSLLLSGD